MNQRGGRDGDFVDDSDMVCSRSGVLVKARSWLRAVMTRGPLLLDEETAWWLESACGSSSWDIAPCPLRLIIASPHPVVCTGSMSPGGMSVIPPRRYSGD